VNVTREKWTKTEIAKIKDRALKGDASAQALLGALYASGSTGRVNKRAAYTWYARASNSGLADAQYNLGLMYLLGEGTTKNVPTGMRLLRAAAAQKYDVAQEALGQIYELGAHGIKKSFSNAGRWYRSASRNGNNRARFSLGMLYVSKRTPVDRRRGMQLIAQAAAAGVRDAKNYLGMTTNKTRRSAAQTPASSRPRGRGREKKEKKGPGSNS
jgi:uncharacterized protein